MRANQYLFRVVLFLIGLSITLSACVDKPEPDRAIGGRPSNRVPTTAPQSKVVLICPGCSSDQQINLLESPSSSEVVGSVPQDAEAVFLEETLLDGTAFCKVSVGALEGWVPCENVEGYNGG